jgi:hypothetical protein
MSEEPRTEEEILCPVHDLCNESAEPGTVAAICTQEEIDSCDDVRHYTEIQEAEEAQEEPEEPEYREEYLKCMFTQDERNKMAFDMARFFKEMNRLEDEKKAVTSDFKAKIDAVSSRVKEISGSINTGWEMRSVKCRIIKDFEERTVTLIRVDDGKVASVREMTDSEMQMSFHLAESEDSEVQEIDVETVESGYIAAGEDSPGPAVIKDWTQEQRNEVCIWLRKSFETNIMDDALLKPEFLETETKDE